MKNKFFDRLEDKIRARLSRKPFIYATIGSVGIVLIWRGIWMIADYFYMPGWLSMLLGMIITMSTGLFVSFFVGDRIILSGVKHERRIEEKTIEEIKREEMTLTEIHGDIEELKRLIVESKNKRHEKY